MRGKQVVFWVVLGMFLVFSGCQMAKLTPEIAIVSIKTPVERSDESIPDFVRVRITNPGTSAYRVYIRWTELDSQGNVVWEGRSRAEYYLSPGYDEEFFLGGAFPPSEYQPGWYTLVLRLVALGPDGISGTSDDVVLSEDRANFELR